MKPLMVLCLVSIVFMSTTCEDCETMNVYVDNKSEETIWVETFFCEDTTLFTPSTVFSLHEPLKKIISGCVYKFKYCIYEGFWEKDVNFQILVFRQSTMDKYTKEELIEKEIFDKRYVLSYDDLKAMNFMIIYNDE